MRFGGRGFPSSARLRGYLVGVRSAPRLQRCLGALDLSDEKRLQLVDGNGETWVFFPDQMILAPGFLTRKWRKVEIIRLFNESRNAKESGIRYPERVMANRRLDTIIRDIAELVSAGKRGQAGFETR